MKDIKSLYLTAKNSGKSTDISAYSEAINDFIEANPNEYIANLEYIISSSIGLDTLNEFVERYGIPISYYDTLTDMLESCIHKAEVRNKDSSRYKEELEKMESFRKKYIGCFMMESYFHDMLPEKYLETYYSSNSKGIQNRKLLTGMIEKFGEAAIPDIIITAHNISNDAMNTAIQYIESHDRLGTPGTCEWLLEATKNLLPGNDPGLLLLESSSLSKIIKDMRNRNINLYRESIIMGKDEVKFEYTESEICSLHDLIDITEYKLTWGDELFESVEDINKDIISLYEEFDGLLNEDGNPETFDEDVADSVVPMLPNGQVKPVEESKWLVNTRNKRTGDAPGYLKKNHNLGYGEDDDLGMKNNEPKSSSEEEIKLDDFKRPSEEDISGTSSSFSGFDNDNKEDDNTTKEMTPAEKQAAINNYYYYTYTNSLNKNTTTGSYNHDNDNSRHTTRKVVDDHSSDKRINSDVNTVEKLESSLSTDVPFSEGVLGTVAAIAFFGPIVLGTGTIIAMAVSSKIMKKKYTKKVNQTISDIIGKSVSDNEKFLVPAKKLFSDIIKDNKDKISSKFYMLEKTGNGLNLKPDLFFSFGMSSHKKDVSKCSADDLLICAEDIVTGLMKKDQIKSVTEILNKLSPDIKFGLTIDDNLPGDDNGGNWELYIKAGICEGGPDDSKDEDEKWLDKQINAVEKSGYVVVQMSLTMSAKKFIIDNFGGDANINEAVGDADDNKPESDHPIKDILTDVDRELTKKQQEAKKKVQNVQNVGRAFMKPVKRTEQWIKNMVYNWKDADENNIKEKMADPHARSNLFSAIKTAITGGSLLKAGLLLNPVFLFLTVTRGVGKNKREFRIRNEMIGELKTELEVIEEKIKDADRIGDNPAKYKLMRLKNEINKKLLRVGGHKSWKKMI